MCLAPTILPEIGPVACRLCWQCQKNRINDYCGRCIAEQQHSDGVLVANLTYGGGDDNPHAAILVYRDFQLMMKKLRKDGYKVRYIVAGEYGSKKGRSHWHAVLFFRGKVPDVPIEQEKYTWKHWEHGYTFFQRADYGGFAYVLKYALKDLEQSVFVGHLAMSKKEPLGDDYFRALALRYVEQNIAPQTFEYKFGSERDKRGRRRSFMMQGKTKENFLKYYAAFHKEQRPGQTPPSGIVDEYWDKITPPAAFDPVKERKRLTLTHSGKPRPKPVTSFMDEEYYLNSDYYAATYRGIPCVVCEYPDGVLDVKTEKGEVWRVIEEDKKQYLQKNLSRKTRINQKAFNRFPR